MSRKLVVTNSAHASETNILVRVREVRHRLITRPPGNYQNQHCERPLCARHSGKDSVSSARSANVSCIDFGNSPWTVAPHPGTRVLQRETRQFSTEGFSAWSRANPV
jgi:hypothetical protein